MMLAIATASDAAPAPGSVPRRVGDSVAHLAAPNRASDVYLTKTLDRSVIHRWRGIIHHMVSMRSPIAATSQSRLRLIPIKSAYKRTERHQ